MNSASADSVGREVLYDILIEVRIPIKLVRLIKMCQNETYSRVRIGKYLSDMFSIKKGLKQGDAVSSYFSTLFLKYTIRRVQVNQDGLNLNTTQQLSV